MKKGITVQIRLQEAIANMRQALFFNINRGVSGGQNVWYPISGAVNNSSAQPNADTTDTGNANVEYATVMPFAGTLKNLYVYLDNDLGFSGEVQVQLFKNGAPQALVLFGGAGTTDLPVLLTNTTDQTSFVAGDLLAFNINNDALSSNAILGCIAVELDAA